MNMRVCLGVVMILMAVGKMAQPGWSAESGRSQPDISLRLLRDAALVLLKEGNTRFAADQVMHPNVDAERRRAIAAEGQSPLVTVLSCSDSRVPVEMIFDRGLGELFAVRVAGNVADTDEIATVEYGVEHLRTPLLLVLGHTGCGAVTAVAKGTVLHGWLAQLVDNIQPAVDRARLTGGDEGEVIATAIRENVWQSMADILRRSAVVRERLANGDLRMLGALYDLESGRVEWMGEHPHQSRILDTWGQENSTASPVVARVQPAAESERRETPASPPAATAPNPLGRAAPSTRPIILPPPPNSSLTTDPAAGRSTTQ